MNIQFKILFSLETAAPNFAKNCLEHDKEIRQKERRMPKKHGECKKGFAKGLKNRSGFRGDTEVVRWFDGLIVGWLYD